jgi:hypothetical protein
MKVKLLLFLGLISSVSLFAQRQDVIASGGDYFSNSNGSLTWTCGEIITEPFSANGVSISQGFNQTNLVITTVEEFLTENFNVIAFPNPTNDFVIIKSDKSELLNYQLFDLKGNLLKQETNNNSIQQISLKQLPTGIYK